MIDDAHLAAATLALYALLTYMTLTRPRQKVSAETEAANLAKALQSVVATSTGNRLCRIAMGGCHLMGAVSLASRPSAGIGAIANFAGVSALCLLTVVWTCSGVGGQ